MVAGDPVRHKNDHPDIKLKARLAAFRRGCVIGGGA